MDLIKNQKGNGGIGFFGLLGVVFIVLKLTDVIDWSWVWVTLPLWGVSLLVLTIFIAMVFISALSSKRH